MNVKENCNLISINNLEECMDNKQMVCKEFRKVNPYGKNLAVFPVRSTKTPNMRDVSNVFFERLFLILRHNVWHKVDVQ